MGGWTSPKGELGLTFEVVAFDLGIADDDDDDDDAVVAEGGVGETAIGAYR